MALEEALSNFCNWLAATPLSVAFQGAAWVVPTVQSVHILTVAILFASMARLDLQLVGIGGGGRSISQTALRWMPITWIGLCVLLTTGIILTIAEPARELMNIAFRTKMALIIIAASIGAFIAARSRISDDYWTQNSGRLGLARALGAVSLLLWTAIIVCGRWIAYL